jgi:hypothetical protein
MGGIIACLAREVIRCQDVYYGPSEYVLKDGVCLWDNISSHAYWDDTLTEDEVDLICSIYRVDTGELFSN